MNLALHRSLSKRALGGTLDADIMDNYCITMMRMHSNRLNEKDYWNEIVHANEGSIIWHSLLGPREKVINPMQPEGVWYNYFKATHLNYHSNAYFD